MEFKDRLKQYRQENNLTQEELAEKLFVTRQAVSKYETGRSYPSITVMTEIAEMLGVSLDDLISKEELTKETISTAEQTKKNRHNLFILLGLVIVVIIISIVAIVLAFRSSKSSTADGSAEDDRYRLVGVVGTTADDVPTADELTYGELFGYCYTYSQTDDIFLGRAYNVSTLSAQLSGSSNFFDMCVLVSTRIPTATLYYVYFDTETEEYLFEKSSEIDFSNSSRINIELQKQDFSWQFKFEFKRVDTLLETKIYEYGYGGERIKTNDYTSETEYTILPDCLYMVIEETFEDIYGNEYKNREIITNSAIDKVYVYPLKVLNDLGFGSDILLIYKY